MLFVHNNMQRTRQLRNLESKSYNVPADVRWPQVLNKLKSRREQMNHLTTRRHTVHPFLKKPLKWGHFVMYLLLKGSISLQTICNAFILLYLSHIVYISISIAIYSALFLVLQENIKQRLYVKVAKWIKTLLWQRDDRFNRCIFSSAAMFLFRASLRWNKLHNKMNL